MSHPPSWQTAMVNRFGTESLLAAALARGGSEQETGGGQDEGDDCVGEINLSGRRFQVIRVDGRMPMHDPSSGAKGVRLMYAKGEIAHFEFDGHRYAVVRKARPNTPGALEALDERGSQATDIRMLLTNRELQVVQFACMGLLTKQIADRLRISEFTVRSYLKSAYAKLGVHSRAAMACRYMETVKQNVAKDD